MGNTTITDTVMRMEEGVCCVARDVVIFAIPLLFIILARELA